MSRFATDGETLRVSNELRRRCRALIEEGDRLRERCRLTLDTHPLYDWVHLSTSLLEKPLEDLLQRYRQAIRHLRNRRISREDFKLMIESFSSPWNLCFFWNGERMTGYIPGLQFGFDDIAW